MKMRELKNHIIIAKYGIYEYKYEKHTEVYRENMYGLFFLITYVKYTKLILKIFYDYFKLRMKYIQFIWNQI